MTDKPEPLPSNPKIYANRDHYQLSPEYERHLLAMTAESLDSKSAIAAELAHRDIEIENLRRNLNLRNEQIDGYERQLGIDQAGAERTVGSEIERLRNRLDKFRGLPEHWIALDGDDGEPLDPLYARRAAPETAVQLTEAQANTIATQVVQKVCELSDYNSPENQPELVQCTVTELHCSVMLAIEMFGLRPAQETGAPHTTEDDFAHWLSYSGKGNRATAEQLRDWREAYFAGVEPTLKAGTGQCYLHPESTCPTPCQGGRKCVLEPAKANAQSFEVRNGPAQETPECRMTPVPAEPSNYPKPGAAQKATVRYPGMQICRKYTQNGPCLNEIDHQGECDGLPHL